MTWKKSNGSTAMDLKWFNTFTLLSMVVYKWKLNRHHFPCVKKLNLISLSSSVSLFSLFVQLKVKGHHFPYVKVVWIISNWSLSWWSKYNLIVCIKDRWTFCMCSIGIRYPATAHKMKIIVFIFDAIYVFLVKNEMVFVNFCWEG